MIMSCVSPDGTYVCSGSENGNIFVWSVPTEEQYSNDYNCKFLDSTCDVDWNSKFNMIAACGFGESYPILMYVYEKSQKEVDFSLGRNLFEEDIHDDKITLGSTPKKGRSRADTEFSDSRRSIERSEKRTNRDKGSVYSDGESLSRFGNPDEDFDIYKSPDRQLDNN
jgi:hypothetical protein